RERCEQMALGRPRQHLQIIEQTRLCRLILVQIPRRDFLLDRPPEELRLRQAVCREQPLELLELQPSDPLPRLERADRLLADAGKTGDVLLTQAAHAADFTKLQNEVHGKSSPKWVTPRVVETIKPSSIPSRDGLRPFSCREATLRGMIAGSNTVDRGYQK